jgi:hypothetical protein
MAAPVSQSSLWRVTLLLAIFIGSSAFNMMFYPRTSACDVVLSHSKEIFSRQMISSPKCLNREAIYSSPLNTIGTKSSNNADDDFESVMKKKSNNKKNSNNLSLMQSIAVVVGCRRLSLLFLSAVIVNFVRSTILKVRLYTESGTNSMHINLTLSHILFQIPKSDKNVFDECPWPFTLFHDPFKFIKQRNTHVVVAWVLLLKLYSLFFDKARVVLS